MGEGGIEEQPKEVKTETPVENPTLNSTSNPSQDSPAQEGTTSPKDIEAQAEELVKNAREKLDLFLEESEKKAKRVKVSLGDIKSRSGAFVDIALDIGKTRQELREIERRGVNVEAMDKDLGGVEAGIKEASELAAKDDILKRADEQAKKAEGEKSEWKVNGRANAFAVSLEKALRNRNPDERKKAIDALRSDAKTLGMRAAVDSGTLAATIPLFEEELGGKISAISTNIMAIDTTIGTRIQGEQRAAMAQRATRATEYFKDFRRFAKTDVDQAVGQSVELKKAADDFINAMDEILTAAEFLDPRQLKESVAQTRPTE